MNEENTDHETEDESAEQQSQSSQCSSNVERQKKRKSRKISREENLDSLSMSILALQEMVLKQNESGKTGAHGKTKKKKTKNKQKDYQEGSNFELPVSNSETTIYQNVLSKINDDEQSTIQVDEEIAFKRLVDKNQISSSLDEQIDTSKELIEMEQELNDRSSMNEHFIADCEKEAECRRSSLIKSTNLETDARDKVIEMVKQAEASQAWIAATSGRDEVDLLSNMQQNALNVDDNYVVIGVHIEMGIQDKIKKGQYIDFAKLLPRERNFDENRLELVNKGGQTYFVPAGDRDHGSSMNSFHKWEQALRVFSNIYLRHHPDRAMQLIQYNHVICTASATFTWENVYAYDREFRAHMANYPGRNWGIILQQAWSMCLKDRNSFSPQGSNKTGYSKGKHETCQRFNKGLCTAGQGCKYEHKCLGCGKFGHGVHHLSGQDTSSRFSSFNITIDYHNE